MAAEDKMAAGELEVLEYPACPGASVTEWNGWAEAGEEAAGACEQSQSRSGHGDGAGLASNENETEAARRSFESGRARGREEGRQAEHEAHAAALTANTERQKQQLGALVARFAEESERYLSAVEQEVVKLALAVASRILRREAQMDPLLLTGAVRVALGQLAATSEAQLMVPTTELELWREAVAHLPNLAIKPQVLPGEGMCLGDCRIESQVGAVDLGVRAQLAEIERGFFDRMGVETIRVHAAPNAGRVTESGPNEVEA